MLSQQGIPPFLQQLSETLKRHRTYIRIDKGNMRGNQDKKDQCPSTSTNSLTINKSHNGKHAKKQSLTVIIRSTLTYGKYIAYSAMLD